MSGLTFEYDSQNDILTIEGTRYSGDIFREWAQTGVGLGHINEIVEAKDGYIVLRRYPALEEFIAQERQEAVDQFKSTIPKYGEYKSLP